MSKNLIFITYHKKILIILIFFVAFSCNKNKPTELRFVNLAGKSKSIKFRIPEENAQILNNSKQKDLRNNTVDQGKNSSSIENNTAINNQVLDKYKNLATNETATSSKQNSIQPSSTINENVQYNNNQQQYSKNIAEQKYDFAQNVANSLLPNPTLANNENTDEEIIIKGNYTNATENIKAKEKILDKSKKNNTSLTKNSQAKNSQESKFYLQLGSFNSQENANDFINKSKYKNIEIIEANLKNKTLYRAVVGPYQNRKIALNEMQKIKRSGQEVVIIKY
jgi:cell division protein FtsN